MASILQVGQTLTGVFLGESSDCSNRVCAIFCSFCKWVRACFFSGAWNLGMTFGQNQRDGPTTSNCAECLSRPNSFISF